MTSLSSSPRRTLTTNDWLATGLVVILLVVGLALFVQQILDGGDQPNFSSRSDEPLGTLGLARWLEKLSYPVDETEVTAFAIPDGVDVTLMLEPESVASGDALQLTSWVHGGGTLILAGQGASTEYLNSLIGVKLQFSTSLPPLVWAQTPLVASPPQDDLATLRPRAYFISSRQKYVTLYAALDKPVVITFPLGLGRVVVSSTAYPFTNAGLTEQGNADFVLNLLSLAPAGGTVWFDEWHHGERARPQTQLPKNDQPNEPTGPWHWLRTNPVGQSILYSGLVVLAALMLSGRAFGRPLIPANDKVRRPPLAYVQAIANLNRRAGHRTDVLRGHYQRLKKALAQRYRLSAALPDAEFIVELAKQKPDLDAAALQTLFSRLQNKKATEAELVQLAAQVADWLKQ